MGPIVVTKFPAGYHSSKLVRQYADGMEVQSLALCDYPGLTDMDYGIALPPDLDISPADLAAAWNEDVECQRNALGGMEEMSGTQMDPLTVRVANLTGVVATKEMLNGMLYRTQPV